MGKRTKEPQLCHYCKLLLAPRFIVPCKVTCGRFFCRKCLTRYYKFSRPKCAKLPSATWKCPVCTKRCYCEGCQANTISSNSKYKKKIKNPEKKKYKNDDILQRNLEHHEKMHHSKMSVAPSFDKTKDKPSSQKEALPLPPLSSIGL